MTNAITHVNLGCANIAEGIPMNLNDPKHPIWPILYQTVPATVIIVLCAVMYKTGLVPKDLLLPLGESLAQKNVTTE